MAWGSSWYPCIPLNGCQAFTGPGHASQTGQSRAWLWSSKLTSLLPWLMDGAAIDGRVSIKPSHPGDEWKMSFISRASPHEVLSFFIQPIHPSAKDWLTMDTIQSAIMTSSLINPPHDGEEAGQHPHTHVSYQQVLFLKSQGSWESFWPWEWCHSEDGSIDLLIAARFWNIYQVLEGLSRLAAITVHRWRAGIFITLLREMDLDFIHIISI